MAKVRTGLLALALMGWTGFAHALALGEIEVRSRLNQQLSAVIPVVSANPAELESVSAQLASNEDFERAGMERAEFLSSLRFEVQDKGIRVWSKDLAREPFVSFLLEVRWSGGRLLREYTVLLDPPTLAQAGTAQQPQARVAPPQAPAISAPAPAEPEPPADEPAYEAPPSEAEATAPVPAPRTAPALTYQGETYGPVSPKETLWSIAYRLRPDPSLTMDQMQVAIFDANPKAFRDGTLTSLMKGVMLRIPSIDQIRAVDPAAAKAQVAAARAGAAGAPSQAQAQPPAPAYTPPPAQSPPVAAEPAPAPAQPADPVPAPSPPPSDTAQAPPPSDTAQAPSVAPPAAEPPATTPTQPASPPVETRPEPAPSAAPPAPAPQEPDFVAELLERGRSLTESPLFIPAAAGFVVLLLLLIGGNLARKKYAKWAYERASRQAPLAAPAFGETAEPSYAESAPSAESMFEAADTPTVVAPPPPPPARMESTQAMPAATMQHTMQQTQVQEPPQATTGGRAVDFDVTGNFANETVQINLDAGDPVSEAEFHRAYGLYDEAALLLKQALQKEPGRTDARVKLAEIYFEASKKNEFVETARELKGQLPEAEWQKIALLGTQIAPEHELFAGGAAGAGGTVDLSFDEPATPPAAAPAEPAAASGGDMLDFKLEDVQLDTPAAPAPAPAPASAAPAGDSLEFDLGDLSLDTPSAAPAPAPAAAAAPQSEELKLDLGDFDLNAEAPAPAASPSGGEVVELSTDLSLDEPVAGAGDEASTKLDLARAYIDMGDNDMAKSLLNEVAQQGNPDQQKEAQELLKRVPA